MAEFRTYNPLHILAVFNGVEIRGYADGSFLEAERLNDAFVIEEGAGGDMIRVGTNSRSGTITFRVLSSSKTNDMLSALALVDEEDGTGYGPLLVKDLNGTTYISSQAAWIRKLPKVEQGKEEVSREWVLDCFDMLPLVGGKLR